MSYASCACCSSGCDRAALSPAEHSAMHLLQSICDAERRGAAHSGTAGNGGRTGKGSATHSRVGSRRWPAWLACALLDFFALLPRPRRWPVLPSLPIIQSRKPESRCECIVAVWRCVHALDRRRGTSQFDGSQRSEGRTSERRSREPVRMRRGSEDKRRTSEGKN